MWSDLRSANHLSVLDHERDTLQILQHLNSVERIAATHTKSERAASTVPTSGKSRPNAAALSHIELSASPQGAP